MSNAINNAYQSMTAASTSSNLPPIPEGCNSWLPNLIQTCNNPEIIESGFKICEKALAFQKYDLSPVLLASREGNHDLLNALHKSGAPIDLPDAVGYTPLHHMAMKGDVQGVTTLLGWGANPEHRNKMGGTYADLLRFNQPFRKTSDFVLNTTLFSAHKKDNVYVSPGCLGKGVTYVDENVAKPDQLRGMWIAAFKNDPKKKILAKTGHDALAKYKIFKESPPKISIEPITHTDAGKKIDLGSSFCGVVAKQAIKKGDPIAEYTGEVFNDKIIVHDSASEYVWQEWPSVDSITYRSAGSMINHAFPNAEMKENYVGGPVDGLPQRKIIVATEDIAEGEQIAIDYGPQYDWTISPIEMRPLAIVKFIKDNKWSNLINLVYKYNDKQTDTATISNFLSIICSSSNLIDLAKQKLITPDDFKLLKPLMKRLGIVSSWDIRQVERVIDKYSENAEL